MNSQNQKLFDKIKKMNKVFRQLDKKALEVGFFGEKNTKDPRTGITQAQKAFYNNFGTKNIPARPFFTISVLENVKKHSFNMAVCAFKALGDGTIQSFNKGAKQVGKFFEEDIRKEIRVFNNPANAPSTIRQKGFNDPLVWTGELQDSVNSEVITVHKKSKQ